jgi:hypothetical protein
MWGLAETFYLVSRRKTAAMSHSTWAALVIGVEAGEKGGSMHWDRVPANL